jgi:hypothetical protein
LVVLAAVRARLAQRLTVLLTKVLAGVLTGQGPMLVKHVLVLAAVQVL